VTNPLFFHPSGKYVYALDYPPTTGQGPNIYAYRIANNGQLVPLSGSPYPLPGAEVICAGAHNGNGSGRKFHRGL
jgi:hypothetical protein